MQRRLQELRGKQPVGEVCGVSGTAPSGTSMMWTHRPYQAAGIATASPVRERPKLPRAGCGCYRAMRAWILIPLTAWVSHG